ncbi:hypothetical protein NODU109028_13640 [Nocardioides dubius]|uniref:O-antigen ligase n=1 Tax=Nocardioides dubius TaxID=317019 RepID=A0ABN1TKI0_9ACTN
MRGHWGRGADSRLLFALIFLGFPVWWALGVTALFPLAVAAVLAVHLLRRREPIHLPPGATLWLLFLGWVALGVFVLGVDAPGAAPGGDGAGRAMVFGYRLAWYLACTAVLLWLGNTSRKALPDRTVYGLVGFLFAVSTAGGLLGLLAPSFEFTSVLEAGLPRGLRANSFVASLVHPQAADIQLVLGRPEARPKAPFAFTNTWGSVMALSAIFAIAWAATGRLRARVLVGAGLAIASVPIVFSLNRGLWACVILGVVGVIVLALRHGQLGRLVAGGVAIAIALVVAAGPLIALVNERMANQHSNARRGSLASATVDSVSTGSPLIGFGTTRDVQGSFASISGGSTPDCPACGVPPLGTQGHFWLVLFSQGWIGVALFLGFLVFALSRTWRCRTRNEILATFVLAFFALQIFVYDTLGLPLMLVFVAIALVWREQRENGLTAWTGPQLGERLRRGAPLALVLALLGAGAGMASTMQETTRTWTTEVRLVLTSPPDPYSPAVIGDVLGEAEVNRRDLRITIDTEAAILLSEETLRNAAAELAADEAAPDEAKAAGKKRKRAAAAAASSPITTQELRDGVRLSAEPNTQILVLAVSGPSAEQSRARGVAIAKTYLSARQKYVDERRTDLLTRLNQDLRKVLPTDPTTATLLLRLNAADRRLRADTRTVGRVVNVSDPEEVARKSALRTTSGGAIGLLVGVAAGAFTATRRPGRPSPVPFRRLHPRRKR